MLAHQPFPFISLPHQPFVSKMGFPVSSASGLCQFPCGLVHRPAHCAEARSVLFWRAHGEGLRLQFLRLT